MTKQLEKYLKIEANLKFTYIGEKREELTGSFSGGFSTWKELVDFVEFMENNYSFNKETKKEL